MDDDVDIVIIGGFVLFFVIVLGYINQGVFLGV
jgi:hypothetical protein